MHTGPIPNVHYRMPFYQEESPEPMFLNEHTGMLNARNQIEAGECPERLKAAAMKCRDRRDLLMDGFIKECDRHISLNRVPKSWLNGVR